MRIDNDFLTLMGLLCRRSNLTGKMVKATEPKTIRAFQKMLDEQGAKIDALVAKINAADDASKDAAPAKPRVVNYPFHKRPKDTAPASPFKSFSLSDEETRDFLLNLADADYFEDHVATAPSKPIGVTYLARTYEEAIRGLIATLKAQKVACPITIEKVGRDGVVLGGEHYVARWTVDVARWTVEGEQPAKTIGDKLFEELRISQELLRAAQAENAKLKAQLKDQEGR